MKQTVRGITTSFEKTLYRAATIHNSYSRVFVGVIARSLGDALGIYGVAKAPYINSENQRDAVEFFTDGRMEFFANSVGLDPEYVKRLASDAGVEI